MALHNYTLTPLQSKMVSRILHDEISSYEHLLDMMKGHLELPVDHKEMEDELIVLKKIYSQFSKKLL